MSTRVIDTPTTRMRIGSPIATELAEQKTNAQKALMLAKSQNKGKLPVKVNRQTTIFINPDEDPQEAINRYNNKYLVQQNKQK